MCVLKWQLRYINCYLQDDSLPDTEGNNRPLKEFIERQYLECQYESCAKKRLDFIRFVFYDASLLACPS